MFTLKQARLLCDKTQKQMAESLSVSRDTYRKIEENPDVATIRQAKIICKITGLSIDQIFFDKNIYLK